MEPVHAGRVGKLRGLGAGGSVQHHAHLRSRGQPACAKPASAQRTTFAYDAANQLTTSVDAGGTTTYTFDATETWRCRFPTRIERAILWDIENRLTKLLRRSTLRSRNNRLKSWYIRPD